MKQIYLVSLIKFSKGSLITYAYSFTDEKQAIIFRDSINKYCNQIYISKHDIFKTSDEALFAFKEIEND